MDSGACGVCGEDLDRCACFGARIERLDDLPPNGEDVCTLLPVPAEWRVAGDV